MEYSWLSPPPPPLLFFNCGAGICGCFGFTPFYPLSHSIMSVVTLRASLSGTCLDVVNRCLEFDPLTERCVDGLNNFWLTRGDWGSVGMGWRGWGRAAGGGGGCVGGGLFSFVLLILDATSRGLISFASQCRRHGQSKDWSCTERTAWNASRLRCFKTNNLETVFFFSFFSSFFHSFLPGALRPQKS